MGFHAQMGSHLLKGPAPYLIRGAFQLPAQDKPFQDLGRVCLQSGEILYDFDTPRFVGDDQELWLGESRYLYYRITIFNEDNPLLPIEKPVASGFTRKVVSAAAGGETHRLSYGNLDASTPSYQLEKQLPYLDTEDVSMARLGGSVVKPRVRHS